MRVRLVKSRSGRYAIQVRRWWGWTYPMRHADSFGTWPAWFNSPGSARVAWEEFRERAKTAKESVVAEWEERG